MNNTIRAWLISSLATWNHGTMTQESWGVCFRPTDGITTDGLLFKTMMQRRLVCVARSG